MAEQHPKGSYTYPNTSPDPDRQNVLKNRWGIRTKSELSVKEYRATAVRRMEIDAGSGPKGNFDKAHLKALHRHLFQDVYEWAGHTRNESPTVEGQRVEPIGGLSKGGTTFLHGSRIEMGLDEAFKPIRDSKSLRNATPEEFAQRIGKFLSELNYVHPFREGNGRAQEAMVAILGREHGREVDLSVITKPRMLEASIETTDDPTSPAMKHVIEDAIDPNRREAIRAAFDNLRVLGEEPLHHNVRTARPGEQIKGEVLGHNDRVASVVTEKGIVAIDRADLPERLSDEASEIIITIRSDFSRLSRPGSVRDTDRPGEDLKREDPEKLLGRRLINSGTRFSWRRALRRPDSFRDACRIGLRCRGTV